MRTEIESTLFSPLQELERDLHDLCQPLTALHCQLESAQIRAVQSGVEEAIAEALGETRRAFQTAAQMQARLQAAMEEMERSREKSGHALQMVCVDSGQ
jgi:NAD-specific glutamate dehydrogenase